MDSLDPYQGPARHRTLSHRRTSAFWPTGRRSTLLPLCFAALGTVLVPMEPETTAQQSHPLWRCPKCGGPMAVIERLTAARIQLRSPLRLVTTATRNCFSTTRKLCTVHRTPPPSALL